MKYLLLLLPLLTGCAAIATGLSSAGNGLQNLGTEQTQKPVTCHSVQDQATGDYFSTCR